MPAGNHYPRAPRELPHRARRTAPSDRGMSATCGSPSYKGLKAVISAASRPLLMD